MTADKGSYTKEMKLAVEAMKRTIRKRRLNILGPRRYTWIEGFGDCALNKRPLVAP